MGQDLTQIIVLLGLALVLAAGDVLVLFGPPDELSRAEESLHQ